MNFFKWITVLLLVALAPALVSAAPRDFVKIRAEQDPVMRRMMKEFRDLENRVRVLERQAGIKTQAETQPLTKKEHYEKFKNVGPGQSPPAKTRRTN